MEEVAFIEGVVTRMTFQLVPIETVVGQELVPRFPFLDHSSDHFKLLRLQSQALLVADSDQGVRIEDETHLELCKSTFSKAKEVHAEILLTPEYSIPWGLVDEMLQNPELQPQSGALWCLCCQGISWDTFFDYINSWKTTSHTVVDPLPYITQRNDFVNVLLYIFQSTKKDELVIIPQLKLQHMRDTTWSHEAAGLSEGNVIFKFGHDLSNQLCSIICADAYHDGIKQNLGLFNEKGTEHWIILHPQLNPEPRNSNMRSFRNDFFDTMGSRNVVYITANWAEGTTIRLQGGGRSSIHTPWSCIYLRNTDSDWLERKREIRNLNLDKGLAFSYLKQNKTIIWHSVKTEHLQLLYVQKPLPGGAALTISNNGARAKKIYVRDKNDPCWVDSETTFDKCLPSVLKEVLKENFEFPSNASAEQRDKFFALCLGNLEAAQLLADEMTEQCRRMAMYIDSDCETFRQNDVDRVAKLTYYLKSPDNKLPGQLGHLEGKYKYCYDDAFGHYNLYPLSGEGKQAVWVVYEGTESRAKELAESLRRIVGPERENKICVFTHAVSGQVKAYPDDIQPKNYYPKYDESITATKRSKGIVEYNRKGEAD